MKLLAELKNDECLVLMPRVELSALVVLGALSNSLGESRPAPMAAQPEPGTDKAVKFAAEMPPLAKHVVVTCGKQKVRAKPRPLANGTRAATCVECGAKFKRKTCEKTCSRECRLARERKQKTAWSRGKRSAGVATKTQKPAIQASVAPEQNQSGSALSTSDRLELIRKRAAAMGVGRDD